MKKNKLIILSILALLSTGLQSCFKDLDVTPENSSDASTIYKDFSNYKSVLAKCYSGLAVTGQKGPDGNADISGIDEGFSSYLRIYFCLQELPTDECKIAWNDQTIQDLNKNSWTSSDVFIRGMFSRLYYQIAICNEFIRNTTDAKLEENGITGEQLTEAQLFRNEARALRALSYMHVVDLFGHGPFVTETDAIGSSNPTEKSRTDLFSYIESELKDLESKLAPARTNEYGRIDQAAAWMMLSKLYLNAQVYTGTARWTDAASYAKKVIDAGYSLAPTYSNLFKADNNSTSNNEFIFTVNFDGNNTQTWGGMTFLVHAAVGGTMNANDYGIDNGWGGIRTTTNTYSLFASNDTRALFYLSGQNPLLDDLSNFKKGIAVTKFVNKTSTGSNGKHVTHPDTDFPMFRLAEAYLTYAEAIARGGSGSAADALTYVNDLRTRAGAASVSASDISNPEFFLAERSRELYWEMVRRTDLIRFGKYSDGTYLWPFKGGSPSGNAFDNHFNLFPIPSADLAANPNLTQNQGY